MDYLDFTDLRIKISKHFAEGELRTLCFDLEIDYEALSGETHEDKIRELILYCQRRHLMPQLLIKCESERPLIDWNPGLEPKEFRPINIPNENLPPIRGTFIGREAEIDRVFEGLMLPYPLISIEGIGGAGKSTLAIKVAQLSLSMRVENWEPFAHVVWISARDSPNNDLTLAEVNQAIVYSLGYPKLAQYEPGALRTAVNNLLRVKRTLIIVDNFETVTDSSILAFLQRIPIPSKAIITSRYQQSRRLWDVSLSGLSEQTALEKIRNYAHGLGLFAIENAHKADLRPLVHITAGNPLAIEMALGYISSKDMALDRVIRSLVEANEDVEELFDYLFAESWKVLIDSERHILRIMHFFANSADRKAIEETAGVRGGLLVSSLAHLKRMSLIETSEVLVESQKRYSAHPLVLSFGRKKFNSLEQKEQGKARLRWAKHYLSFAQELLVRNVPSEPYWNTLLGRNLDRVDPEKSNLINVLSWAMESKQDEIAVSLMMILVHYLGRRAHHERFEFGTAVIEAAKRLNNIYAEAIFTIDTMGWAFLESGRPIEGKMFLFSGMEIANSIEDEKQRRELIALANAFLIRVYLAEGNVGEAKACLRAIGRISEYSDVLQDRINLAAGDLSAYLGEYLQAIAFYKAAIENNEHYGGDHPKVEAHYRIGDAFFSLQKVDQAESKYQEVLAEYEVSSNFDLANAFYGLACVARYRSDYEEAYRFGREARAKLALIDIHTGVIVDKIEDIILDMERAISSKRDIDAF